MAFPSPWRVEARSRVEAMNPTDFLLLGVALVLASCSLAAHGPTMNGLGPAVLLIGGAFWHLAMQWLRHRSWQRHRDSGGAPGTQHLDLLGITGCLLCTSLACLWAFLVRWRSLP